MTTPFDMVMRNDLDRFHLVMDVIDRVPGARLARRSAAPADGRRARRGARLRARARRGPGRDPRLDLAALSAGRVQRPRPERGLELAQGERRRDAGPRPLATVEPRAGAPTRPRATDRERGARGGARRARERRRSGRRFDARRPPRRPRRDAIHASRSSIDDDGGRAASRQLRDLAPLHNAVGARDASARRASAPGRPARRRFDTAFHAHPARRGGYRYPVPAAWYARVGRAPLRLPRPVGRVVGRGARRELLGRPADELRLVVAPPRQRLLGHGGRRRAVGRHLDGHDAARGPDDGHAARARSTRACSCSC